MVVGKTGAAEVPTDPMPPEATDMIVVLKPQSEWKTKNLMMNWLMRSVRNWKIFRVYSLKRTSLSKCASTNS